MNKEKQHNKLLKLQAKAQSCVSRKAAQKVLRKAEKASKKLAT